ncbi:MAG: hypothetical protein ACRDHE_16910 [Ktedonobacterales bacterium]
MPTDFRHAWYFATREYECNVEWVSDAEIARRWRHGQTSRVPRLDAVCAPRVLAVAWNDGARVQVRLAQSRRAHPFVSDALMNSVHWLLLLAAGAQVCALDLGPDTEPLILEQRPVFGPLPRTTRTDVWEALAGVTATEQPAPAEG